MQRKLIVNCVNRLAKVYEDIFPSESFINAYKKLSEKKD